MKVDNIEATLRNSEGEHVRVMVDLFYREVLIHRPGTDRTVRQAISASVIQTMAFDVSHTVKELREVLQFIWFLMDTEGRNIMEAGIKNVEFGEK